MSELQLERKYAVYSEQSKSEKEKQKLEFKKQCIEKKMQE